MSEPRKSSSAGIVAMLGVAGPAVLCCAGPVLVAGGALSVIGGAVHSGGGPCRLRGNLDIEGTDALVGAARG